MAAIAVEGGQHDAASTVEHLEAALWCALASAGVCVHAAELARATTWLEDARGLIYSHARLDTLPPDPPKPTRRGPASG